MKKSILLIILLIVFQHLPGIAQTSGLYGVESYRSGELIIQLPSANTANTLIDIKTDFSEIGLVPVRLLSRRMNIWLFKYEPGQRSDRKVLYQVKDHPLIQQAQFNHYVFHRELIPDDQYFGDQWALDNTGQLGGIADADIDATDAWEIATGGFTVFGDTIVVAIIDLGFDLDHEDLDFWKNYEEIPDNDIDDDENGYIDDYDGWNAINHSGNINVNDHGTHVAGIAAAIGNNGIGVSGVNWQTKVLAVASPTGIESSIVEAYGYVLEVRSRYDETDGEHGAFVVATNASFGVDLADPDDYPIWGAMYDSLGAIGILSTGATANANWDIDVVGDVPTAFASEYLITVTNTTNMDVKFNAAGYGLTTIDLGAPGYIIQSTRNFNTYGYKSGTSMSTPHVTGAIALMFATADTSLMEEYFLNPSEVALSIKQDLLASVDLLPDLEGITVTGGRLNLHKALRTVRDYPVLNASTSLVTKKLNINVIDTSTFEIINIGGGECNFIIAQSPPVGWVTTVPIFGTLSGGDSQTINLYFDTDGLSYGDYSTNLLIQDNDNNEIILPIHLTVTQFVVNVDEINSFKDIGSFPNPFHDETYIHFILSGEAVTNINIYNSEGKPIRSLMNHALGAGEHMIKWNGRSDYGTRVPEGIYYCRLKTISGTSVTKLLLLK